MASITTSVVLLRWPLVRPLVSAVLMFLASSLNIQLRKSDYAGLAVICSCLGLAAACWFATGLLGITLLDIAKIWGNIKDVMIEVMSQTPPEWPMMMT
ncbi:TPA: YjcB family protein [Klebsiella pneumoniae]